MANATAGMNAIIQAIVSPHRTRAGTEAPAPLAYDILEPF
jgi:hypothetical protein